MLVSELKEDKMFEIPKEARVDMLQLINYEKIINCIENWMKEIGINTEISDVFDNREETSRNDEKDGEGGKEVYRMSFHRHINLPFVNKRPGYDFDIANNIVLNITTFYPSRRTTLFMEFSFGQRCYFISFPNKELQSNFFKERFMNFLRDSFYNFKKEQFSEIANYNPPTNIVYEIPNNIKEDMLELINYSSIIYIIEKWMDSIGINKRIEKVVDTRAETKKK